MKEDINAVFELREDLFKKLNAELKLIPRSTYVDEVQRLLLRRAIKFFYHTLPFADKQLFRGNNSRVILPDDFFIITTSDYTEGIIVDLGLGGMSKCGDYYKRNGCFNFSLDNIRMERMTAPILERFLKQRKVETNVKEKD